MPIAPAEPPHVLLLVETATSYGRQLLHGIARYLRSHRPWSVFLQEYGLGAPVPNWLKSWHGDGIMCRFTDANVARLVRRKRIAAIDLSDRQDHLGLPRIWSDHTAIGRAGAVHLCESGLRQFGFYGFSGELWSVATRCSTPPAGPGSPCRRKRP